MSQEQIPPRCAECGQELTPGAEFCAACGRAIDEPSSEASHSELQFTPANHFFVALLLIATVSAVVYRYIEARGQMQTYATFIGLPLLIGVLTAYLVRPRTGLGATLKITTILLCVVAPLLGEGMVCLLMAAPIIYLVAMLGYLLVVAIDSWFNPGGRGGMTAIILLPFVVAELTSSPHAIRNPSIMTVTDDRLIAAAPDRVWEILRHDDLVSPDFPLFLRLGFPLPTKLERQTDGETRLAFDPGSEPWPGTNVIVSRQVADGARRRLTFFILDDGTKLARWLTFLQTRFEVEACAGGSRVRQTTTFRQRMQPGLYWNPLQRFAVGQMHRYALSHIQRLAEARPR